MLLPKLYIGSMSKNIIDCIIKLKSENYNIGIIPSRRQIDYFGGYVNKWNTESFVDYIRSKDKSIILCRDHSGPRQGKIEDDGIDSIKEDCNYFNIIHIDPWKLDVSFSEYLKLTVKLMNICYQRNPKILFEIGTEEGIKKLSTEQVYQLIKYVREQVDFFDNVRYAVIQSGTNLKMDTNTGYYNEQRLIEMIQMVKEFKLLTKEHNGDYLNKQLITSKFNKGLDSINIAPEIGKLESECYLDVMTEDQKQIFFDICYKSNTWVKWLKGDNNFNPIENKEKIIKVCGHYNFSNDKFVELVKDIDIKECLYNKIKNRVIEIIGDDNGKK